MKKSFVCTLFLVMLLSSTVHAKWARQYNCSGAKNNFFSVGAFDENKATASGQSAASGQDTPVLMSTGSGAAWADATFEKIQTALIFYPWIISTPSSQTGYMSMLNMGMSNEADLETSSSGSSWTLYKGTIPGAKGAMATSLYFSDPQNGSFLGTTSGANWLARTTDAAATWDQLTLPYDQDVSYTGLFFMNDKVGWVAGGDPGDTQATPPRPPGKGMIQYTADGGKTWKKAFASPQAYAFDAIAFSGCLNGWASAHDATKAYVLHSSDGGKTWKEQTIPKHTNGSDLTNIGAIRFFDASEGWAAGNVSQGTPDSPQFAAAMLHTTDGGKTWTQDTTYNDAAKADDGSPCCMPDPPGCKGFMATAAGQAHGAMSMAWPTRNAAYVVGTNLVIMKYTADTPSTKTADRCVECGGGKCHGEPVQPDAGPGNDVGPTDGPIVGPDGEIPDAGPPDTGPADTGPADTGPTNILPAADIKMCFSEDTPGLAKTFETVVSFAERKITGDLDVYVFPGSPTLSMADARTVAQADGVGTVAYLKIAVSAAYKITAFTMQVASGTTFAKLQSGAPVGQLMEKNLVLTISGLKAALTTEDGKAAGTVEGEMTIPVLSGQFIGSVAGKTLDELFNTIREPCPTDTTPDAGPPADAAGPSPDGQVAAKDAAGGGKQPDVNAEASGGGCSCGIVGGQSTATTAAFLAVPFLGLLGVLLCLGRRRNRG